MRQPGRSRATSVVLLLAIAFGIGALLRVVTNVSRALWAPMTVGLAAIGAFLAAYNSRGYARLAWVYVGVGLAVMAYSTYFTAYSPLFVVAASVMAIGIFALSSRSRLDG